MTGPRRIQRRRTRGWRMPAGAVYVGRPTVWGNPYRPAQQHNGWWVPVDDNGVVYDGYGPFRTRGAAARDCVRLFWEVEVGYGLLADRADIGALAGRVLACWCPLDQLCQADVLLRMANGVSIRA